MRTTRKVFATSSLSTDEKLFTAIKAIKRITCTIHDARKMICLVFN